MSFGKGLFVICALGMVLVNATMSEGPRRDWSVLLLGAIIVVTGVMELIRALRQRGDR